MSHSEFGKSIGENNDCSVIACAIACNVTYQQSLDMHRRCGRRDGGRTSQQITRWVIERFGFDIQVVCRRFAHCKTVRSLSKNLPRKGTFLVVTRGHILVAKNGEVHDWTRNRLHRIRTIYEVTK